MLHENIRNTVFSVLNFDFAGTITEEAGHEGVYVRFDGRNAVFGFSTKAQEARCCFLLALHSEQGSFEITEKPVFDTCGPMLDMSRGAVMKVDAVKRYLDCVAALGLNMLMLYTEDTYEVPGYPQFGYHRGRYTLEELRAIDDHADSLGIEVIPCIQTLGHLEKYLRWPEAGPVKDTTNVLLAGSEDTYRFIEAEIRTVRSAFRSDRIHLGMDEAHYLGLGNYRFKNGYRDQSEIFYDHLKRVLEIAKKYYREPMIWSDMLFQTGTGQYYRRDWEVPQERIDNAPKDVTLVFWDYYKEDYEFYDHNLAQHRRFPNEIAFAGGVWTWDGFAPYFTHTLNTMKPALQSAIDRGIRTVIATKWGNDGSEADYTRALAGLAVFSEYCYKGRDCADEDVYAAAEKLTGMKKPLWDAISSFYLGLRGAVRYGKGVFYVDPLISLMHRNEDLGIAAETFRNALAVIRQYPDYRWHRFYELLFSIVSVKAQMLADIRPAYEAKDMDWMKRTAQETIPQLLQNYREFYDLFRTEWARDYKSFGFETHTSHFGGVMLRLEDTARILLDFAEGRLESIEPLEEPVIMDLNQTWRHADSYMRG